MQSLQNAGEGSKAALKIGNELGEWFNISIGIKQGDPVSPSQFMAYLERVVDGIQNKGTGVTIQEKRINLRFADDLDLIEDNWKALQESVHLLDKAGKDASLNINI